MNTFIAILALGAIVYALAKLTIFNTYKYLNNLAAIDKQLKEIDKNDPEYKKKEGNAFSVAISGCWSGCLVLILGFSSTVAELVVIIYALVNHLGDSPMLGYIALGFVFVSFIWAQFVYVPRVKKDLELAKLKNETYVFKRNIFSTIIELVPTVFCLYIFLILIS